MKADIKAVDITALKIKDITNDLPSWGEFRQRKLSDIKGIIIHHSAAALSSSLTPKDYANIHHRSMDAPRVCYHFNITAKGEVNQCNALTSIAWHAGNYTVNSNTIGIELDGNFENEQPTKEQLTSLKLLIMKLSQDHTIDTIKPHCDIVPTLCPGKNLKNKLAEL